ncbi:MAG: hypothetical protein VYE77_11175 [Planctomycetota bacterium]|nr:hypothetical protein [Planctomycetota bacterium]
MRCLGGIDEAGLGPILGPMVVAGCAFQGPDGTDLWQLLKTHVSRKRHDKHRIRVADSKKVNQGPHGLSRLEATALCFWTVLTDQTPSTFGEWAGQLGIDTEHLKRCPWYERMDLPLPLRADADWIQLKAELIRRQMERSEVSMLTAAVRPVDVEEWNGLIADTDNKSRAHFLAYSAVLAQVLDKLPGQGHLVADRCGARMHYARDLQNLRPQARVETLSEQKGTSAYRIFSEQEDVTVTFAEKGEDRSFPTALASCMAKYVRELMLRLLNDWFGERIPGLRPTAGYYVDGKRFLADIDPHLAELQLDRRRLVRVR